MIRRIICMAAVIALATVAAPAQAYHGLNCPDFDFQEDAQAYFDAHPGDPEGLDGPIGPTSDGVPNVACEDLPSRGSTGGQSATLAGADPSLQFLDDDGQVQWQVQGQQSQGQDQSQGQGQGQAQSQGQEQVVDTRPGVLIRTG